MRFEMYPRELAYPNGGQTTMTLPDLSKGNEPTINRVMWIIKVLIYSAKFNDELCPDMCMTLEQIHESCDAYMRVSNGLGATIEEVEEILNSWDAGELISRFDKSGKTLYRMRLHNPNERLDYSNTYSAYLARQARNKESQSR